MIHPFYYGITDQSHELAAFLRNILEGAPLRTGPQLKYQSTYEDLVIESRAGI
jgi:hypothetical protein